MNERIRELAEQAGLAGENGHYEYDFFDPQKFAELIARECAGVVAKDMDYHANWCGDKILKHFGVEE